MKLVEIKEKWEALSESSKRNRARGFFSALLPGYNSISGKLKAYSKANNTLRGLLADILPYLPDQKFVVPNSVKFYFSKAYQKRIVDIEVIDALITALETDIASTPKSPAQEKLVQVKQILESAIKVVQVEPALRIDSLTVTSSKTQPIKKP